MEVLKKTNDVFKDKISYEIVVVNDCSTDGTVGVLKSNNISYLSTSKNSGGPNTGRNIALKASTGDYLCIVDHDDAWDKNKVASQIKYLEKVPIVTCGFTLIDSEKNKTISRVSKQKDQEEYNYYPENATFITKLVKSYKGQNTYIGGIMYRSELKDVLFEEEYGAVDFDWVLRLFHERDSIEVCESLYNRFVDENNLSMNEDYRKKDYDCSLKSIQKYKADYQKEVNFSAKKINGSMARYYYQVDDMKLARKYFLKSNLTLKTILYFLTTFAGASFVRKKFNVFG